LKEVVSSILSLVHQGNENIYYRALIGMLLKNGFKLKRKKHKISNGQMRVNKQNAHGNGRGSVFV